jgi:hypothetical protein
LTEKEREANEGNRQNILNGMGGFNRVIDNRRKAFPTQLNYSKILRMDSPSGLVGSLTNVVVLLKTNLFPQFYKDKRIRWNS